MSLWGAAGEGVRSLAPSRRAGAVTLGLALPVFGCIFGATYALEPAAPLAVLGGAVSVGGLLVSPLAGHRLVRRASTGQGPSVS